MPSQSYYPTREGEQLTWFTNLQTKIPAYYTALDVSAARQAKLSLTLNWLIWTWQTLIPSRRQDAPAAIAWRNQLASGTSDAATNVAPPAPGAVGPVVGTPYFGMVTWLLEEVSRWKASEGYNENIGQSLAIIGSQLAPPDFATIQPRITAVASGGIVKIGWNWQGFGAFLDLCEISVDRGTGGGFEPLAIDSTPGYDDTTPYPAAPIKWIYRAIYRVTDHQVGQWSQEVSVVVGA
jgi:hypothetical protein